MTAKKQVFETESRIRWNAFKWISRIVLFLLILIVPVIWISLARIHTPFLPRLEKNSFVKNKNPVKPKGLSKKDTARYRGFQEFLALKKVIDPVGYLEMIWLLQRAGLVLTDSGGVQKEAFFFGKPCVTMRDQTEWVELVTCGANILVGADRDKIVDAASASLGKQVQDDGQLYGGGQAAGRIAEYLAKL